MQVVFQSQIPIQEHEFGVIVHPTMVLIHMEDTEVEGDIAQHVYEPKAIPHVTALRQQCELIQVARIVRLKLQRIALVCGTIDGVTGDSVDEDKSGVAFQVPDPAPKPLVLDPVLVLVVGVGRREADMHLGAR